jgi:predicted transglutaminase-like cysteine proteinase
MSGRFVERWRVRLEKLATVSLFVLALTRALGPVQAQELLARLTPATPLVAQGAARALPAWVDFCHRVPAECEVRPEEPTAISLTQDVWELIVQINRGVNATIKPLTDQEHWGVADRWDLPDDGYGDCEDFQLLKRKLLADHGLPRRAMRMTVVIDDEDQGHAVLTIRTDQGDFILDNRTNDVLPWDATEYTFVKREGEATRTWVSLGRTTSPLITAAR